MISQFQETLYFASKGILALLLVTMAIREWRSGYFDRSKVYFQTRSWTGSFGLPVLFFVLLGLTFIFDEAGLKAIQALASDFVEGMVTIGRLMGKNQNIWSFLVGGYVLCFFMNRREAARRVFGMIVAASLSAAACEILKLTFLRARPAVELGPYSFFHWEGLVANDRIYQSFPSGDVAVCAGAVGFLFYSLKGRLWRYGLLVVPALVALMRIYVNRHWPSDTLASLGMSLVIAQEVWNYHRLRGRGVP